MLQVLKNIKAPLKLGYIMVKNRNQKALDKGQTLEEVSSCQPRKKSL